MRIGLMVEGQNGLSWERWIHILQLAERLHFPSVFRSDHYFIGEPQDSLEAYLSFAVAARETSTIRFGPLVTPVTFRAPVDVGRMAAQIDLLSGGRFVMGLGAGWNGPEHRAYGIPFPSVRERMDRLEEALLLIRALWNDSPATFTGQHYQLERADLKPKPASGRPPILVGGSGEKRTLKLVARYASEWNCVNLAADVYAQKRAVLERHCEAIGRDPSTIARSMMAFAAVGPDTASLDRITRRLMRMWGVPEDTSPADYRVSMRARGLIAGTTDEVVDCLGAYARAGLQEIDLQHLDYDDDTIPEYIATELAPKVSSL